VKRLGVLAACAAGLLLWPNLMTHPSQKVENVVWVVSSTPAYKGHPTDRPNTVECSHAGVEDFSPTKIVNYVRWAELKAGDPCPEGDR